MKQQNEHICAAITISITNTGHGIWLAPTSSTSVCSAVTWNTQVLCSSGAQIRIVNPVPTSSGAPHPWFIYVLIVDMKSKHPKWDHRGISWRPQTLHLLRDHPWQLAPTTHHSFDTCSRSVVACAQFIVSSHSIIVFDVLLRLSRKPTETKQPPPC